MAVSSVRPSFAPRLLFSALLALVTSTARPAAADVPNSPAHPLPYLGPSDPARARHLGLEGLRTLTSQTQHATPIAAPLGGGEPPDPQDHLWWGGFGLPVLNSVVHAVIVHDGALIAGGEFTFAGDRHASHIARWDGSRWVELGDGLDGPVFSLAVHQGRLIAGGEFFGSGAVLTGCVAQWDGTGWRALGEPAAGCVHSFAHHGANLVAGGCFTTSTGVHNVGAWDGTSWLPIGEGVDGHVLALATYHGEIVAGGDFSSSGFTMLSAIARFDGADWQPLGSGVTADSKAVHALAVFDDELIAGGWFEEAGGVPVRSIARWNGEHWDSFQDPGPEGIYQSFILNGEALIAAGYLHDERGTISIARWDGVSWTQPAEPMWGVRALTSHQGHLVAGGYFQEAWPTGEPSRPVVWVGRLEGTRWRGLESWAPGWSGVFVSGGADDFLEYQGRLVVAGSFQYAGSAAGWLPYHGLAEWDGSSWSPMAELSGYVYAIEAWQGDLIAGGNFRLEAAGALGVARWDGSSWSPMGAAGPLRALAVYRGELYGAGWFWKESGGEEGVARWDGDQWRMVGGGFPFVPYGTWVGALAVHDDRLIAAGRFDRAGSVEASNIAAWDGRSWQPVGPGRAREVQSLAVYRGELYAGGAGSVMGSPSALARWDGSAWHEIDVRGCTFVGALHSTRGVLFAGGLFNQIAGADARNVAVWDGTAWSPLGSGLDSQPRSFGTYQGSLYVGGWFTEAGGKPSFGIARWDGLPGQVPAPRENIALMATPNPFSSQTDITYSLGQPGRVRVEVFDVRGRKVDTVLDHYEEAGPGLATWRPGAAARVPPGLYFARVLANGQESVARIVYAP